ncbi:MAG: hypothetical protein ACK41P_03825 [Asticcacaulis sp.]
MPENRFNRTTSAWAIALCLGLAPSVGLSQTAPAETARPAPKPAATGTKAPTTTVKSPAATAPVTKAPTLAPPPKPALKAPVRSAVNWAEALEASAPEPVQKAKTQIQSRQAVDPRTKLQQSGEKARANLKAAPALAPKALDATRLPVLLPSDPAQKAKAKMVSFGEAYSIAIPPKDGLSIAYSGTTSFAPLPKAKSDQLKAERNRPSAKSLAASGLPDDLKITRTEDGWTASFTRFGVLYSVDILCEDLQAPNCKDDKTIRKAVEELRDVVLGQAARAEAEAALLPRPTVAPVKKGQ